MTSSGSAATLSAAEGEEVNGKAAEVDIPAAALQDGTAKCNKKKKKRRRQEAEDANENGTAEQEDASIAAAVLHSEGTQKCKRKKKQKAKETTVDELEPSTVTSDSEGILKCKKKKEKVKETTVNEPEPFTVTSALEGTKKGKVKGKMAEEGAMARQEDSEGTKKCKKKKTKEKAKETTVDEPESSTVISDLQGTQKCKKKKKERAKEITVNEPEPSTVISEGTQKCKKKKKRAKETIVDEPEPSSVVSALEGTKKDKLEVMMAEDGAMARQEATPTAVSDSEGTQKCKKKKKKERAKENTVDDLEPSTVNSALEGTKNDKFKGMMAEDGASARQEASATAVSDSEGTLKCKKKKGKKKKERAKETTVDEPEPSTVISALEVTKKHKINAENGNDETCFAEQETKAAVSASEGTTEHKRKLRKKNKMQKQQESTLMLSDLVAVDVANKSGNGGRNVEGASEDADVSMNTIDTEDPGCSKLEDGNGKMNCKSQEGNKNCSKKFCSFQEGSEDGDSQIEREKRKRKREASRVTSPQIGEREYNPPMDSSCLLPAHEEKVKNIYSPRGSLIRFQRKKLLILDLNGLLADINMDKQNEHMAHAKVRGKLVFKRPYYDEFLRFCFQHFELGIWSSRKMENVKSVVDILMQDLKQYLLFCWDMSMCTFTGCKVIGDKHKPLVLKELKKLWNKEDYRLPWKQGEFSPSNTLLVDDSPYKALCNPPHTAIFPEPYSYLNERDDCSLGPGGDLRVYLERLAAADDVQDFVRDNPFGQPSITESDPKWNFYEKIIQRVEKGLRLKW